MLLLYVALWSDPLKVKGCDHQYNHYLCWVYSSAFLELGVCVCVCDCVRIFACVPW